MRRLSFIQQEVSGLHATQDGLGSPRFVDYNDGHNLITSP